MRGYISQTPIYRAPIYRAPIYREFLTSPNTVHLQVFSVKQNPDLPGSSIYRENLVKFAFPQESR